MILEGFYCGKCGKSLLDTTNKCFSCGERYSNFEEKVAKAHNKAKIAAISKVRTWEVTNLVRRLMAGSKLLSNYQTKGKASQRTFEIAFKRIEGKAL